MNDTVEFKKIISEYSAVILYKPMPDEIDYFEKYFPIEFDKKIINIPQTKDIDPFEFAETCVKKFKNEKVFILIPGTKFDIYGNRQGRGGGWYDRFLSKIPGDWLKVGIIDRPKFSDNKIETNEWDVAMDWVFVKDDENFYFLKT